jgi:hypothetical protein
LNADRTPQLKAIVIPLRLAEEEKPMPMNDFPCPRCGARCFPDESVCASCGVNIDQASAEAERYIPAPKYPALRAIATAYQIFALAIAVVTLIAIVITLRQSGLIAIICLVAGLAAVISFLAVADGIKVFVDIEHNTRTIIARLDGRDGDNAG